LEIIANKILTLNGKTLIDYRNKCCFWLVFPRRIIKQNIKIPLRDFMIDRKILYFLVEERQLE